MKRDHRIPMSPRPKFEQSNWLLELKATGEPVVVLDKTFFELCELMNAEYGTDAWELHDREFIGVTPIAKAV
jgi:hypothetical protein